MSRKTVGMITSYKGVTQSDWLWHQTPHHFGVWDNIQVLANAPAPDFLLLYNFTEFKPKAKAADKRWFKWVQSQPKFSEPELLAKFREVPRERLIFLLREPPFEEKQPTRLKDYKWAEKYCGYVSGPDDLAPVPDYMPAIWYLDNSFRELNESPPPEKVKPCSWITSGIDRTVNHRHRLTFLKLLRESDLEFDLYGRGLPDWVKGNGPVSNKWQAMAPYHYNLAIENYAENNWYVSEKLWDALLAWCLPIYYGGPAVDKLLPPGSFLRLPSMDEKGLAYIRDVISTADAWYAAKDAIAEARQIILHELNLINWLSNYVKKFQL